MKSKKCKICHDIFIPIRSLQPTCEKMECMIEYTNRHLKQQATNDKKEARKELKQYNMNDIPVLKRKAQKAFNEFIRLRDKDELCISCKYDFKNFTTEQPRQKHAGHYRPQGGNSLWRYEEKNCHAQCSICNNHLSANLIPYRENLIKKIGLEEVEILENTNTIKKWTKEELQDIIKTYKGKFKLLENIE